jgi:hypothetical protein
MGKPEREIIIPERSKNDIPIYVIFQSPSDKKSVTRTCVIQGIKKTLRIGKAKGFSLSAFNGGTYYIGNDIRDLNEQLDASDPYMLALKHLGQKPISFRIFRRVDTSRFFKIALPVHYHGFLVFVTEHEVGQHEDESISEKIISKKITSDNHYFARWFGPDRATLEAIGKLDEDNLKRLREKTERWKPRSETYGVACRVSPTCGAIIVNSLAVARIEPAIIHELAHLFGLDHCEVDHCVMNKSLTAIEMRDYVDPRSNLTEYDSFISRGSLAGLLAKMIFNKKTPYFCTGCRKKLGASFKLIKSAKTLKNSGQSNR